MKEILANLEENYKAVEVLPIDSYERKFLEHMIARARPDYGLTGYYAGIPAYCILDTIVTPDGEQALAYYRSGHNRFDSGYEYIEAEYEWDGVHRFTPLMNDSYIVHLADIVLAVDGTLMVWPYQKLEIISGGKVLPSGLIISEETEENGASIYLRYPNSYKKIIHRVWVNERGEPEVRYANMLNGTLDNRIALINFYLSIVPFADVDDFCLRMAEEIERALDEWHAKNAIRIAVEHPILDALVNYSFVLFSNSSVKDYREQFFNVVLLMYLFGATNEYERMGDTLSTLLLRLLTKENTCAIALDIFNGVREELSPAQLKKLHTSASTVLQEYGDYMTDDVKFTLKEL